MSNTFTFNGSILKAVKDYNNVIKASVVDRRLEYTPTGEMASKFTASRQVTITDPAIQHGFVKILSTLLKLSSP